MKSFVVEKDKLVSNIKRINEIANGKRVIAVLKGYGYGLGIVEFANLLKENGVDFFAVSEIDEAVALRQAGFTGDILFLTATSDEKEISRAIVNDVTLSVGSESCIELADKLANKLVRRLKRI